MSKKKKADKPKDEQIDLEDLAQAIEASTSPELSDENKDLANEFLGKPIRPGTKINPGSKADNFDFIPIERPELKQEAKKPKPKPEPKPVKDNDNIQVKVNVTKQTPPPEIPAKPKPQPKPAPAPKPKPEPARPAVRPQPVSVAKPKPAVKPAAIKPKKRRQDMPSTDLGRPPIPKLSRIVAPVMTPRQQAEIDEKDDKFAPIITEETPKPKPAPKAAPAKPKAPKKKPVEAKPEAKKPSKPVKTKPVEHVHSQAYENALHPEKPKPKSPKQLPIYDTENYHMPISPTRHHRKNDFVIWLLIVVTSLIIATILIILGMSAITQ